MNDTAHAMRQENGFGIVDIQPGRLEVVTALLERLDEVEPMRALLLVAGHQALDHASESSEHATQDIDPAIDLMRSIWELEIPVVCAVAGKASGPGVGIALACDIVIAGESASFEPTLRGIHQTPSCGMSWLLPRLLGPARAMGTFLLADKITAREAQQKGLIWKCVPDDRLLDEGRGIANYLAEQSPEAMRAIKEAVYESSQNDFDEQLDLEEDLARDVPRP
ncbi:MAG TPA: enoyl-CoA hydratase-related protein [Burkholderiales bacterium]|nr:enoyl-CoA hydratase-related protein [Burkholderiales bacterium]